jgi:YHS domain-containing protein
MGFSQVSTGLQNEYPMIFLIKEVRTMAKCPVCGMMADEKSSPTLEYKGKRYYFHTPQHKLMFEKDPEKFLGKQSTMSGHQ